MPLLSRIRRRHAAPEPAVGSAKPRPPSPGADPAALSREIARLREMLDLNSDWIWEVDAQGRYTYASRHCLALLGRPPEDVIGRTPFDLMPPDEAERISLIFGAIAAEKRPFSGLLNRNLRSDGSIVVLETSGIPLLAPDGALLGYRGIDRDVTEREAAAERLRHIARHDDLTGLPNRFHLREHLDGCFGSERGAGPVTLLAVDLDGFKPVNDRLGHEAGDAVLRAIGARLAALATERGAFAARLGGDEFVMVSREAGPEAGSALAAALRATVGAPIAFGGVELRVAASVGIACWGGDLTADALLALADRDLYRAKAARAGG